MPNTPQDDHNEQKSQVQDYFSRTAESYVSSFSHKSGDDLQRLVELGEWDKRQQALDIATGGGHTALAIAPYVAQVTVSDLTPRMLEKAREYLTAQGVTNAQYVVADAEHLPFAAETFDRVTCRIAAHHFPNVAGAVNEVARVLKVGGSTCLSTVWLLAILSSIASTIPLKNGAIPRMDGPVRPKSGRHSLPRLVCK
jgi:ubiquinone/menaquinone biosynthesis C-methylase UbiE